MNNPVDSDKSLGIILEEYVRLRTRYEALVNDSFADFRLLAAIGALIVWPPLATSDLFQTTQTSLTLLIGFIGILFLIAIIAVRDMVKWAIIEFYLQEMRLCETEIRTRLGADIQAFQFAQNWPKHYQERYIPVFIRFSLLFVLLLIFLPTGVFYFRADYQYMVIYLISFAVVIGIQLSAAKALGAV
jgi:hypothetical protein